MVNWYSRLPPEEQRIVLFTLFGAAAALWLAVAWEEVILLAALPLLAGMSKLLIRRARRRADQKQKEWLF